MWWQVLTTVLRRLYQPFKHAATGRMRRHLAVSLADHRPVLIVLLYHQVTPDPPEWLARMGVCIRPETFERHLRWCRKRFPLVKLSTGIEQLRNGCLGRTSVAVTFDDGMQGVAQHAAPILKSLNVPVTLFVNRDFLLGGSHWLNQVAWLEGNGYTQALGEILGKLGAGGYVEYLRREADQRVLTRIPRFDELYRRKANGQPRLHFDPGFLESAQADLWEIGNHSCSHPRFSRLPATDQQVQIEDNAGYLSRFTGYVPLFAVPFGTGDDWNAATVQSALACGHEFVTAYGGVNVQGRTGVDIRRIPCDAVPADQFEEHMVTSILGW